MSKTVELARHLSTLNINNMYKTDFYWTWDKTDDEIDAIFTVADALRDLRERNKSTRIFDSGLGISLFRDNSTRTRFSFASACNLLGLEEQVLDEKKSQIAHGETVRETANMVSFMADVIGIRDDMFIGEGHKYQKTFMDALDEGYRDGILEQRPTLVNLQTQQITGGGKGEAGAGGVVPEDGDTQTGIKDPGGLIPLPEIPQRIGYGEDGLQFLISLVPSPIKVGLIHIVDVQTL